MTFRRRAAYGLDELDDIASVKNTLAALDRARRMPDSAPRTPDSAQRTHA